MPGLFSSPSVPKPAPVAAPAVMPTQDDQAIQAAKQQKAAALMAQSGRASTIYSQNAQSQSSEKFG